MPNVSRRTVLGTLGGAAALAAAPAPAEARAPKPPRDDDLGLLFDSTRCVGCRACTVRCREANSLTEDVKLVDGVPYDAPIDLNDRTLTVIKRTSDGADGAFVKAQCMHCADPACVSVCMLGALHKGERGVVAYDVSRCVGCRYCQVACPFNVPRFQWSSATPRIVKCELCRHRWREGKGAACAEACPREAVVFGARAELRAEAHRRLEAEPDRYRAGVYGEREGGGTGVLVLSAVPFTAMGLPALGPEAVPALGETIQHGIYQGFVAPVALFGALAWVTWRNRRASDGGEDER
ncbi:hydrogenase 2 operon protein HybA [Anaeromyxobacter sp. Fw109-5]|uniref:hydrogenase 2 operon protein HybA n=1 Tax=Anaeromyxobacter sp. (strain Fw109-5) TaxID=404589 RepID=UPI0000ED7154|nr:hydrogenase 2 operon protein HybA [Anaeromyxobacter sp. Fw109-5]ABS27703.1 4Fe-4S ferredoxin iron-sulfur binding domain protein [Anaeromyxobacter sp. Fw109-5]